MVVVSHEIGFDDAVGAKIALLEQGRGLIEGGTQTGFGKPRHPRLERGAVMLFRC